jgi:hypothetical protein
MCQTHSTAMPQIHRSSRFWFWDDYERSQDICGRIDELMILVMDPPHLGVWNGVYHGIPALDWDDLQGCPVMVYWDVSWLVWPFWFDRIKVAIGEVDSAVLCPILRTHQISPISRVNKWCHELPLILPISSISNPICPCMEPKNCSSEMQSEDNTKHTHTKTANTWRKDMIVRRSRTKQQWQVAKNATLQPIKHY